MGKLLLWVGLIALIWLALRMIAISQRRSERSSATRDGGGARGAAGAGTNGVARDSAKPGELIVPCMHCGVFLPASDALRDGERAYCSRAHLDAHRQEQRASPPDE